MRAFAVPVIIALAACTSPAERKLREAKVARTAIAVESAKASVAASQPATGRWDEAHLVERLVRSGLAPQALPGEKSERYWGAPLRAYRVGSATLYAYIYSDSASRRRVTDGLDTLTAAPKGSASPYPPRHIMVLQNNLAAVLVGGSDRQQDRVSLALGAGLPVSYDR
jgi:hypothetical protein